MPSSELPKPATEEQVEVEMRARKKHDYRAHAFTCAICRRSEEALCCEGHRLLVDALR